MTSIETSIFTKIINREIPGFIPYETDNVTVLISLEGHPLIIPKQHFTDIYELPEDIAAEIMQIAVKVAQAVKKVTGCEGINLIQSNGVIAGQDVFHFHLHIKPRYLDDDVKLHWNTDTQPEKIRNTFCNELQKFLN